MKKEVTDGIICSKKFGKHPKSKHKILWILKEANDPEGGGWSLTDFLATRVDKSKGLFHYGRWAATFGLVIKVSYGLLNGFINYDKIEKDLKKASEILDYIAVINLKKVPGGRRAYSPNIVKEMNLQRIKNQIIEIDPDIIIGGSTLWILAKNNLFLESKDLSKESWGLLKNNILWVDAFHPNNTTVTHKVYYSEIIKLAKNCFT
jgi:hypothetical protein